MLIEVKSITSIFETSYELPFDSGSTLIVLILGPSSSLVGTCSCKGCILLAFGGTSPVDLSLQSMDFFN